ncbi:MAG: hypothetical protein E4H14_15440 [Candidatus Thorarchaeota archaeon]|nr:MAG: hypothetical protein E4H14_15440 [Candidatus Thorarchaeota archaeon]
MDLGTFGAIIKFALEIEGQVLELYTSLAEQTKDGALKQLYEELVSRGQKRIKTLERVRRENVTEMILEPIEGLDSDSFRIETAVLARSEDTVKTHVKNIESILQSFYEAAATKIDFLPEAAYAFELLAEKNEETIKRF